jgi:hypothetical protein
MTRYSIVQFEDGTGESWFQIKKHWFIFSWYYKETYASAVVGYYKEIEKYPLEKMARAKIAELINEDKQNKIKKIKSIPISDA